LSIKSAAAWPGRLSFTVTKMRDRVACTFTSRAVSFGAGVDVTVVVVAGAVVVVAEVVVTGAVVPGPVVVPVDVPVVVVVGELVVVGAVVVPPLEPTVKSPCSIVGCASHWKW
jgi:hypothetical protein